MRVRALEQMHRHFALMLSAVQFVFFLTRRWPPQAVLWLRKLGGKPRLKRDRGGPFIPPRGLNAVWQAVPTLSSLAGHPFPHHLSGVT